jgi:hypothetical protein
MSKNPSNSRTAKEEAGLTPTVTALIKKRQIPIYYTEDKVPSVVIEKICTWYRVGGASITKILSAANKALDMLSMRHISYVDVYSILYRMAKQSEVTVPMNRVDCFGEISISEFPAFFRAWQDGKKFDECFGVLTLAVDASGKPPATVIRSRTYARRVFASLMDRLAETRDPVTKKSMNPKDMAVRDLLGYAERRLIGDRPAVVIFVDKLPVDLVMLCVRQIDGFTDIVGCDLKQNMPKDLASKLSDDCVNTVNQRPEVQQDQDEVDSLADEIDEDK